MSNAAIGFSGLGKVGPKAIGPSRFWFTAGSVPEPNEDTKKLYEAYTYLPHTFALRKWTKEEDEALEKFVLHAVQVCRIPNLPNLFPQTRKAKMLHVAHWPRFTLMA